MHPYNGSTELSVGSRVSKANEKQQTLYGTTQDLSVWVTTGIAWPNHNNSYLTGSCACISIGRTEDCPDVSAMTNLCTSSLRRMFTMLSCAPKQGGAAAATQTDTT